MAAPVAPGEVLAQKYRVDRVLGEGGMGVVVAATHLQLDQRVAIKFMLPDGFSNPDALARFMREARAAVRLRSHHVARVLDTGTFENGAPYIVMEYLEGTDLAQELETGGPMPAHVAAEYVVQACDAIAEAHSLGIVHRDLKPANLFLARHPDGSPLVKVLDFGISKTTSLSDASTGMTKTSAVMGSPLYMSPEQVKSAKDVDARTDVWSLGVILYVLLGGSPPFEDNTLGGVMAKVLMETPVPLATRRPELPPELCALVHRCLEKDRLARCQSVAELAAGLAPFCPSRALPLVDRIAGMSAAGGAAQKESQTAAARRVTSPQGGAGTMTNVDVRPPLSPLAATRTADGWNATGQSFSQPTSKRVVVWSGATFLVVALGGAAAFFGLRGHGRSPEGTAAFAPPPTPPPPPSATEIAASPPAVTRAPAPAEPDLPSSSPPTAATTAPSTAAAAAVAPVRSRHVRDAGPTSAAASASAPAASHSTPKPGILDTSN